MRHRGDQGGGGARLVDRYAGGASRIPPATTVTTASDCARATVAPAMTNRHDTRKRPPVTGNSGGRAAVHGTASRGDCERLVYSQADAWRGSGWRVLAGVRAILPTL